VCGGGGDGEGGQDEGPTPLTGCCATLRRLGRVMLRGTLMQSAAADWVFLLQLYCMHVQKRLSCSGIIQASHACDQGSHHRSLGHSAFDNKYKVHVNRLMTKE